MIPWLGWALVACAPTDAVPAPGPRECRDAFAPAPGPLAAEVAGVRDPLALAELRIREARLAADPGFYELADLAVRCRLAQAPDDDGALALHASILVQFHRFAEAERLLSDLAPRTQRWEHWAWLGDARVDQGDLAGAAAAWDEAVALRPGPLLSDRLADLAWQQGDLEAAIALQEEAFGAAPANQPEVAAWLAGRLGWYRFLAGQVPNELGVAVRLLPEHVPSRLLVARWLVATGRGAEAGPHLDVAGDTVEALLLRRELDPSVDVSRARLQDRRGWALVLAETDPAAALPLLDRELSQRRDATTRVARAWVAHRVDPTAPDPAGEVAEAVATGILEPSVLLMAAEVRPDAVTIARLQRFAHALPPSGRVRLQRLESEVRGDPTPPRGRR